MELLRYKIYAEDRALSFQKPVMVLLHGLGGGYANWYRQVHVLKAHYDLVLIELPSHGHSPVKMSEMELTFDAVSKKVMEVVDHLEIKKATFVGVSLGTMIVKNIVLKYSDRVDKYILIGPVGAVPWWTKMAINMIRILMPVAPMNMVIKIVATFLMPYKTSKYGRDVFMASAKRVPKEEFIAWCRVLVTFQDVQKVYQKTMQDEPNGLYMVGELDYFFIPLLNKDRKRVKNMVFIKHAGHACMADQADIANRHIIAFQDNGTTTI